MGLPTSFRIASGALALLPLAVAACSNSSSGPDDGPPGSSFTMLLDNSRWEANAGAAEAEAVMLGDQYQITISSLDIANTLHVFLELGAVTAPGTYPLGVDGRTIRGGNLRINPSGSGTQWSTSLDGSGSVTITHLGPNRIAGSFSGSMTPLFGNATGTRVATDGQFDLEPSQYSAPALAPQWGGSGHFVLGGVRTQVTSGYGLVTNTGDLGVALFAPGGILLVLSFDGIPAPGTYPLTDPGGRPSILLSGDGLSVNGTPTGTVTIASVSAHRVVGHFTAQWPGAGIVISEAEFDLGITP